MAASSAKAKPEVKQNTRPTDPPFAKDSRIGIIGAGPAGLTMAYDLQKRGYSRVCEMSADACNAMMHDEGLGQQHWQCMGNASTACRAWQSASANS